MKPLHRSSDADVAMLQMENDLLTHEVRHLRARMKAAGVATETATSAAPESVRNQQAYADVRWLVKRLNESAMGMALRRTKGFQVMVERYGQDES